MAVIEFNRPLILATASEARRSLVAQAGFEFETQVVSIDESPISGEEVGAYVERLARAKANAATPTSLDAVIVAVDTAIGIDGEIIGKPADEAHARAVLKRLSGRAHEVSSAIAVRDLISATIKAEVTRTEVRFVNISDHELEWYIQSGEWRGRAGAYAIQGKGSALVEEVGGCFTNVIGISIPVLVKLLKETATNS